MTRDEILEDNLRINVLLGMVDEWVEEEKYEVIQAVFDAIEDFFHDYHPLDEAADLIHPDFEEMSVIFPY